MLNFVIRERVFPRDGSFNSRQKFAEYIAELISQYAEDNTELAWEIYQDVREFVEN